MQRKPWLVGALIAGVLVAAAGAGAVLAQSSGEGDGSFLSRVAAKLGVAPEDLEQAVRDVRNEDVDAAAERGDLTEEQAQRLKERLAEKPVFPEFHRPPGPEFGFGFGPNEFGEDGKPGRHFGHGFGFGLGIPEALDDLAAFLGLDREQLLEELAADGASLASVAEAHGKSRDELKAYVTTEVNEKLDDAVAEGLLSDKRAEAIRARIEDMLDEIIDMQFGFPWKERFHFDFRFDGGDDHEAPDETTPEPQGGASEQIQQS